MPADYNIPMTDAQITQALQLMVERVSEGWAQETYDGSPVGSGSPYYHKSSKWWATQAADAAARAEAAVPAGTAGAVFFDRVQTLTDAQAMQARANIVAGGSNPNLLDNPWFTVNQRGLSRYTGPGYTVDRWRTGATGATIDIDENGVTLSPDASFGFQQKLTTELVTALVGKTVTYSILLQNGTLRTLTFTWPNSPNVGVGVISGIGTLFVGTTLGISFVHPSTLSIRAIKLELGSVSTLANDAPPCYAEELAKCQRYFKIFKASSGGGVFWGVCQNTTTAIFPNITNSPQMRTIPTATFSGTIKVRKVGSPSTDHLITGVNMRNNPPVISLECTTTGLTAGDPVMLMFGVGAEIALSADL